MGGGVLIAVRRGLRARCRPEWCSRPDAEELWVTVEPQPPLLHIQIALRNPKYYYLSTTIKENRYSDKATSFILCLFGGIQGAMKVLSLAAVLLWASVYARPDDMHVTSSYDQFKAVQWSPFELNNKVDQLLSPSNKVTEPAESSDLNREEFIIDDCEHLATKKNHSAKTIITRDDKITKCIEDLSRVLHPDDGVVIILGAHPLNVIHLQHSKLFFNKYYVIPKHIQHIQSYIYNNKIDIKVFVGRKAIATQLYELIHETKYEEAIDLGKFLFILSGSIGKSIIADVVRTFLKNEDYIIMNYAYKLMSNNGSDIITSSFPHEFNDIFSGNAIKIQNKNQTAALRLSSDIDYYDDRWVYSDCKEEESARDTAWRFIPVWNTTLECVLFEIYNIEYHMRLKLNWKTTGYYNEERESFGDHRPEDDKGRFQWRLMPTGVKQDHLLFCIVEEVFGSYLVPNSCEYEKKDVRGMKTHCSPRVGWLIEPSTFK
ncbi:lepidopteran low molecular weight (30 kD) lipoprotein domain-containing protein [Phthorimaea operculella]|nr:lepidopteran low molecular weight (30 kD) lipoprotein domain-containing protein [Phthorimaea operculella]